MKKVLLAIFLLLPVKSFAVLGVSDAANSGNQTGSSYSFSINCADINRYILFGVSLVGAATVSSITHNSVGATLVRARSSAVGAVRVEMWELIAPASGTQTISVTLSAGVPSVTGAQCFKVANQVLPVEASNDNSATNVGATDATVSVTSIHDGDIIFSVVASDDTTITPSQSSSWNVSATLGTGGASYIGPNSPQGAQTMTWTNVAAAATWTIVAVAVRPYGTITRIDSGTNTNSTNSLVTTLQITTSTLAACTNPGLIVAMHTSGTTTAETCKWNAVSMTQIGTGSTAGGGETHIFYMKTPPVGNLVAQCDWATTRAVVMSLIGLCGVDQQILLTDIITPTTGTSTTCSTGAITSADSDMTIGMCGDTSAAFSAPTQTSYFIENHNTAIAGSYAVGGTSATHQYTIASSVGWHGMGFHVLVAPSPVSTGTSAGMLLKGVK